MGFIAYYFHWPLDELLLLEHKERRKWCDEVSRINDTVTGAPKNIFDM